MIRSGPKTLSMGGAVYIRCHLANHPTTPAVFDLNLPNSDGYSDKHPQDSYDDCNNVSGAEAVALVCGLSVA